MEIQECNACGATVAYDELAEQYATVDGAGCIDPAGHWPMTWQEIKELPASEARKRLLAMMDIKAI